MASIWDQLEALLIEQSPNSSDASAASILAELGSPTVSCAFLDRGEISSRSFSTQGDDTKTLFQACSISKPIAGTMCMRLVDQGKLDIDAFVVDLLPQDIVDAISHPLLEHVQIKHLLSHTSGLSVHGFAGYNVKADCPDAKSILLGKAPANSEKVTFETAPGHMFSYSGGGMTLLQLAVEHTTGMTIPQLVQDLVFRPLGMVRSCYSLASGEANFAKAFYTGYQACDEDYRLLPEQVAAGVWTTPSDLLKLVLAIQDCIRPVNEEETFLKRDTATRMLTEIKDGMSLSWFVSGSPTREFSHGGSNDPGYRCYVIGFNDGDGSQADSGNGRHRCGIAVMTNSAIGYPVTWKVIDAICYQKGWHQISSTYGVPEARVPLVDTSIEARSRMADGLRNWVQGDDWASSSGWKIIIEGPTISACFGEQNKLLLLPAAMPKPQDSSDHVLDAVLDGANLMFRFVEKDSVRWIDLHHGSTEKILKLVQ